MLHAQIGRRWLTPEYESVAAMLESGEELMKRWNEVRAGLADRSEQRPWWPNLLAEVRANKDASKSKAL